MLPEDVPPERESNDLRRIRRQEALPSMRTVVRWALECDSAEQLGKRLSRRYQRKQRIERARQAAISPAL